MVYYLSEIYTQLPLHEKRRIQRRTRTIFTEGNNLEKLRKTIRTALQACPPLDEWMDHYGIKAIKEQALENAGVIYTADLGEEELESLKKIPHFVFPSQNFGFLCAEAKELLLANDGRIQSRSLFETLIKLSPRERNAFSRWIKADNSNLGGRFHSIKLFRKLIYSRKNDSLIPLFDQPLYLDQIWSNDPNKTRMAWFYRDILPFYQCLREDEEMHSHSKNPNRLQMEYIDAFKNGRLIIAQETPVYNQKVRYRVFPTLDKIKLSHQKIALQETSDQPAQGILFS